MLNYSTRMYVISAGLAVILLDTSSSYTRGDSFGIGANRFELDFVLVDQPGNPDDTTGAPDAVGGVDYSYRIAKYETPEEAIRKANAASEQAGNPLGITLDDRGPQKPATGVSWYEAARFVNWLNEEKGRPAAYRFDASGVFQLWTDVDPGYDPANPFRNSLADYFLPSVDEWYKAAYYDPIVGGYWDYPTGSDDVPMPVASGTDPGTAVWNQTSGRADVALAGGQSPFGTVGQGGNVNEWNEGPFEGVLDSLPDPDVRALRGGTSGLSSTGSSMSSQAGVDRLASRESSANGFRIASRVPEPSACILLLLTSFGSLYQRR